MSNDLSLTSIDNLVEEIERRCASFVMAYQLLEQKERDNNFATYYGAGLWSDAIFLSAVLHNDCLNNWNKELTTLQRLNEEENEGD